MRRREFIGLIGIPTIWPMVTRAQGTTKMARVAALLSVAPGGPTLWNQCLERLQLLGWDRGRNLIIEARYVDTRRDLLAAGAAELVALSPDVIVAANSQTIEAALAQTSSIPIVMVGASHPVEAGFIKSLASPGSNVTGVTNQLNDIDFKALGLLREAKPGIDRVGVLYTPSNAGSALAVKQLLATPRSALGLSIIPVPIDRPADIETAFALIDREGLRGLQVHPTPVISTNRARIAALLIERRVPTVTAFNTFVRDGILMSYGPDLVELWRDAASYIDRILRGARPADLPVQQPTKFLFVVNLKTAKAIGVDFSPSLLARADEVIE